MLSWLTLDGGLAGNVIPRQVPEVVVRDEGVVVGEVVRITSMKKRKNSTWRPGARLVRVKPITPRAIA